MSCDVFTQMEAVDASGLVIPVSVWLKNLEGQRCLVVMEPVERNTATFMFDSDVSQIHSCVTCLVFVKCEVKMTAYFTDM